MAHKYVDVPVWKKVGRKIKHIFDWGGVIPNHKYNQHEDYGMLLQFERNNNIKKVKKEVKNESSANGGGKGTRIAELFPNMPKPLIPIQNIPVLEREIVSLASQGFTDFILTVGYLHQKIQDYFGDGSNWGVNIEYFVEDKPLGNAGALFFLDLKEDFLLLNADAVFDVDFTRMCKYHQKKGGLVTIFTHPNSHPYDSGLIISSKNGEVQKWLATEDERPLYYKNRVNAGLHIISPKVLEMSGIRKAEYRTKD